MLSTPIDILGPFAERKRWSAAIADRLNFPESDAFSGYSAKVDPLSRIEIAAKLKKIRSCGNLVELRNMAGDLPEVHNFQKCGQIAVCPVCAARAQAMRKKRFGKPIEGMAALCGGGSGSMPARRRWPVPALESFQGLNAYMVTATIRPRETLREGMNHLTAAWNKFRRMGQKRDGGRSAGEFGKVVAALAKVEIKKGAGSGKWHPHIHALVFTRERLDYRTFSGPRLYVSDPLAVDKETGEVPEILLSKISFEWLKATGGDSYNIRCDSMRTYWEQHHRARGISFPDSVRQQAAEVLKYATKWNADPDAGTADFDARDFVEVVRTTYCRRLFATYGYFRRIPGSDFVGSESGENLFWNRPGKPRPEIWAARWTFKGFTDLEKKSAPVFQDSDPLNALINWEYNPKGELGTRENPRAIYLRDVAKVNGRWRRARSLILKLRDKARGIYPGEYIETLLNRARHRAQAELMNARTVIAPWFQDTGPPEWLRIAMLEKYRLSKEYNEKLNRAFLEVLEGPAKTLAPA